MCSFHWSIRLQGPGHSEHLGSVRYQGGISPDRDDKLRALRRAIRLAAGWSARQPDERSSIKIENCSCNGMHEVIWPFFEDGLVEPELRYRDEWFDDELGDEACSFWSAEQAVIIADNISEQQARELLEAAGSGVILAGDLIVCDRSDGAYSHSKRIPLEEYLRQLKGVRL